MQTVLKENEEINVNYGSITTKINVISADHSINYANVNRNDALPLFQQSSNSTNHLPAQKSPKKIQRKSPTSPYFRPFSPAISGLSALKSPSYYDEYGEEEDEGDKINTFQAGFTVINLFLGLCLLSYPYALSCGSLTSLIAFIFICFALCYTGKLIVRCFNTLSDEVEHSYPMIGYYSFNNFGYLLISFGIMAELFGALCTNTFSITFVYYLRYCSLFQHLLMDECVVFAATNWVINE